MVLRSLLRALGSSGKRGATTPPSDLQPQKWDFGISREQGPMLAHVLAIDQQEHLPLSNLI